jgi:hypothetical protein
LIHREIEFYRLEDLIDDQGDMAVIIDSDPDTPEQRFISSYMPFDSRSPSQDDLIISYLSACDHSTTRTDFSSLKYESPGTYAIPRSQSPPPKASKLNNALDIPKNNQTTPSPTEPLSMFAAKKKYKPVALKV